MLASMGDTGSNPHAGGQAAPNCREPLPSPDELEDRLLVSRSEDAQGTPGSQSSTTGVRYSRAGALDSSSASAIR